MQNKHWLFSLSLLMLAVSQSMFIQAKGAPVRKQVRAANGSTGSNKGTAANTAYLSRLRAKLLNNWSVPNGKNRVVLSTTINADGSVGDVSLTSTPKSADAEIAGSEAFAKSQPLEALPGGGQAKLVLTFESSADPHGDSSSNVYTQIIPVAATKAAPAAADSAATPAK